MNYYNAKHLASAFRTVRNNTIKIAEEIPESEYNFRPAADVRSVSETLVHIGASTQFPEHVHGHGVTDLATVNFPEMLQRILGEEQKPRTKAEVIAYLKSTGDNFAAFLESRSDAFLGETVAMPAGAEPAAKSRFEMLLSPKEHEMHHRGQLMTMQRMMGVVPHLTRDFQARMAARSTAAQGASR